MKHNVSTRIEADAYKILVQLADKYGVSRAAVLRHVLERSLYTAYVCLLEPDSDQSAGDTERTESILRDMLTVYRVYTSLPPLPESVRVGGWEEWELRVLGAWGRQAGMDKPAKLPWDLRAIRYAERLAKQAEIAAPAEKILVWSMANVSRVPYLGRLRQAGYFPPIKTILSEKQREQWVHIWASNFGMLDTGCEECYGSPIGVVEADDGASWLVVYESGEAREFDGEEEARDEYERAVGGD